MNGSRPTANCSIVAGDMRSFSLQTDTWAGYFRAISLERGRLFATVTLQPRGSTGRRGGVVAERALRSIRYEPSRDVLELGLGGGADSGPALRCFISTPRQIVVEESHDATAIVIDDARAQRTVIGLRRMPVGIEASFPMASTEAVSDSAPVAHTHFVDRVTWRLTCPTRRPLARRTCRTYLRDTRRGTS
jgi:hypothetical protein